MKVREGSVIKRVLVATVVLGLLLSGGAVAASQITSSQIKNGTIKMVDISSSAKKALKGNRGATGPQGAQGPAGPSAVSGLTAVPGGGTIPADTVDGGVMPCPGGQRVVSGGFATDSGVVFLSAANADRTGWTVALDNAGSTVEAHLTIVAYCAGSGQAVAARVSHRFVAPRGDQRRLIAARRAAVSK